MISELTSLTVLYLNNNHLSEIGNLGNLSRLNELNLSSNDLEALPQSVGRISSLTALDLSVNKIAEIRNLSFGDEEKAAAEDSSQSMTKQWA